MVATPFHAYYKARQLSSYTFGQDKLLPAFASADIEIYPYQIAAARFALRSPYLKGVILCDEGSLGKTYEALLAINQLWYEGKERILLVVPTPLLGQWRDMLESSFSLQYFVVDSNEAFDSHVTEESENPFMQEGVLLTTYDFAAEKAEWVGRVRWDAAVFEEAHHLRRIYTGENKNAVIIKEAVGGCFKLLLTATPMQNSIMDLYGLIYFIDETVLPDADDFYKRYFRKPENYGELAERVSKYCFRTTRPQVSTYVKLTKRIPITAEYTLTQEEQHLYELLDAYIGKPKKAAFPKMEQYDLALMLFRNFSSSTFAVEKTLKGAYERLQAMEHTKLVEDELTEFEAMLELCGGIKENAKGKELLTSLKQGFARLKELGANKKALVFTENRTTQRYLRDLLEGHGYKGKVLMYSGDKSRDYSIMRRFRDEAQILIATDVAAEGFNMEFCSFVVNYDLPYNTLTIEQRINRCHRQNQQTDILVLSFLNRNNFADVRMLELINKRVLQFDGVMGMSDNVIGNFGLDFSKAAAQVRGKDEVNKAFDEVLSEYEEQNKQIVSGAEQMLFTSFSKEVADSVHITPQYVAEKVREINDGLWELTKYFFGNKQCFHIDDETRTLSCLGTPPKVFTGAAMRRNEYSMAPDYQPRSGRHTITGALAKNILREIFWKGVPSRGTIIIDGDNPECNIGYYEIGVVPKGEFWNGRNFYVFAGRRADGQAMTNEECRAAMELPVASYSEAGAWAGADELDALVDPEPFIKQMLEETDGFLQEEIAGIKARAADRKAQAGRKLDSLRQQIKQPEAALGNVADRMEKLERQKRLHTLQRELKQAEQNEFFDKLRIEQEMERQVQELIDNAELSAKVERLFVVRVYGEINERKL